MEIARVNLDALAGAINEEHRCCEGAVTDALVHAMRAGELLTQAKRMCTHGTWQSWLKDNFEGSVRTAQAYMRVFAHRSEIESELAKAQTPAHFDLDEVPGPVSLDRALKILAQPKPNRRLTPNEQVVRKLRKLPEEMDKQAAELQQRWLQNAAQQKGEKLELKGLEEAEVAIAPMIRKPERPPAEEEGDDWGSYYLQDKTPEERVRDRNRVVELKSVKDAYFIAGFADGRSGMISRKAILEQPGWKKCSCCRGIGVVQEED